MSPAKYARIRARIAKAAKRFGVESQYNRKTRRRAKLSLSFDHPQYGRVQIRHMSDEPPPDLFCVDLDSEKAICSDNPSTPVWIQLAIPGRYFKDGSFFELNDRVFSDIIRNFETSQNKRAPIDFEHACERRGSDGMIPLVGAPAQGWITALELRGNDGLWGLVEWNDLAREYILGKRYRYISPSVRFNQRDRHTGENVGARLTSAGLTNIPFLDGMQPLAAKDTMADQPNAAAVDAVDATAIELKSGGHCFAANEYMPQLKQALRVDALATKAECMSATKRLREHLKAVDGDHTAVRQGVSLAEHLMPLRELVNAGVGDTWDDVLDMIEDLIAWGYGEHLENQEEAADMSDGVDETITGDPLVAATATTNGDATMNSDNLATQLKDVQTEKTHLELQLKDVSAQLSSATESVAKLTAELATFKDDAAKRAEAELEAEVDAAILAYKDSKGIKSEDKPTMLALLKAAPEAYRKLYPKVAPAKQYLLRSVVTGPASPGPGASTAPVAPGTVPDIKTLTDKYVAEGKTLEEAVSKAFAETSVLLKLNQ